MLDYFKQKLKNTNNPTLLDMNFYSSYIPKIGFRYNLEALVGVQSKNQLYQVLGSIVPPGSPYVNDKRTMFAAFPFSFCDWDSKQDFIKFNEDDIVLNGLEVYKSSCILLDINTYDIQKKEIKHYGFAVYPLAEAFQNRIYFLSGVS